MKDGPESIPRTTLFRTAIASFITERKEAKLKGTETTDDTPGAAKYDYTTWLADAARRVSQIQAVTHVLKATHPDARGTSLHAEPSSLRRHEEIGSHLLSSDYATDIVGNAAALDVYKFLKVKVSGEPLLHWFQQHDPDLLGALHDDPVIAHEWADAFNSLIRPVECISSHEMAKQVYWSVSGDPTDDAGFHLLQPLFPSSLVHAVHQDINDARFGEANKAARQAWRDKARHPDTYRDYRDVVARKLGGTKPQNISQLNSERGGVNYLLSSLPPIWGSRQRNPLLGIDSAFKAFRHFDGVAAQIKALHTLFESKPEPTMEIRLTRERIERALGRSLAAFAQGIGNQFAAGWTIDTTCQLPLCQQLWLDPGRADLAPRPDFEEEDLAFSSSAARGDWASEVAKHFGLWLNEALKKRGLPVGHAEYTHWVSVAATYITPLARDLEAHHG